MGYSSTPGAYRNGKGVLWIRSGRISVILPDPDGHPGSADSGPDPYPELDLFQPVAKLNHTFSKKCQKKYDTFDADKKDKIIYGVWQCCEYQSEKVPDFQAYAKLGDLGGH